MTPEPVTTGISAPRWSSLGWTFNTGSITSYQPEISTGAGWAQLPTVWIGIPTAVGTCVD